MNAAQVDEYLGTARAREAVALISRELNLCAGVAHGVSLGWLHANIVKAGRMVGLEVDGEIVTVAYYYPARVGEPGSYIVSDLGNGAKDLRLRTRFPPRDAYLAADPIREALRRDTLYPVGSMRGDIELSDIAESDLPDAICQVMRASWRLSQAPDPEVRL